MDNSWCTREYYYFQALVGDMNGPLLPPKTISEGVYNTLVSTGKENDVPNIEKLQEWYDIDAQSEQLRYVLKVKILDVVFNHRVNEKERAWYDVSN